MSEMYDRIMARLADHENAGRACQACRVVIPFSQLYICHQGLCWTWDLRYCEECIIHHRHRGEED